MPMFLGLGLGLGRGAGGTGEPPPPTFPPINTVAPAISGTPTEGETLTATQGTWSPTGTSYAYQWRTDGVDISGATSTTYVLVTADVGANIDAVVTATNTDGSTSASSNSLGPVAEVGGSEALTFQSAPVTHLGTPVTYAGL